MAAAEAFASKEDQLILPHPRTIQDSALLVKKLTGVAVSHIAYGRNLFDEHDFDVKSFSGMPVRVISGKVETKPAARSLNKWLVGAFDALDRRYLKTLCLEINDKKGNTLETYTLTYNYVDDEISFSASGNTQSGKGSGAELRGSVRGMVRDLIRNLLVITSTMVMLPEDCVTCMKLTYYDEVTPPDYEPPGFQQFTGEKSVFDGTACKITCGTVATSWHEITLNAKLKERIYSEGTKKSAGEISCLCEIGDKSSSMLECSECKTLQHAPCYKVLTDDKQSQKKHVCLECTGTCEKTADEEKDECIFRRVLAECMNLKSVSIRKLMLSITFGPEAAVVNLKRLQREGLIPRSSQPFVVEKSDYSYTIVTSKVNYFKSKYFTT